MIKVDKNLQKIPASLNSDLTSQRRTELVENNGYIHETVYDSRYKTGEIKRELEKIYHGKCAYCEQDVSDSFHHVEHYRPKSVYYWLAYSWDNLLLCCDKCNVYKKATFEIDGEKAAFSGDDLNDIHTLAGRYNKSEKPRLIHPELEDVERLRFSEKGGVDSDDKRARYTIETCRIDRKSANERRKKIYDDFLKKYRAKIYEYKKTRSKEALGALKGLVNDFMEDAENPKNEYLAFRRWIVNETKCFKKFRRRNK